MKVEFVSFSSGIKNFEILFYFIVFSSICLINSIMSRQNLWRIEEWWVGRLWSAKSMKPKRTGGLAWAQGAARSALRVLFSPFLGAGRRASSRCRESAADGRQTIDAHTKHVINSLSLVTLGAYGTWPVPPVSPVPLVLPPTRSDEWSTCYVCHLFTAIFDIFQFPITCHDFLNI